MPISPIVLQRRHAELGRIRLGAKKQASNGRTRPAKLETFRFTSASERYVRDLAALYGGEPRPWDNNGKAEWEVYSEAKAIPVIAVKGGLSQWMETWSGGGCIHRCDGERGVDGSLCDPDDKAHQEAKPTTRLSVMLPELEAIGVWRMESHGWNSAAEIPAVAELAAYVGDLVPAYLNLVERRTIKDGQTSRFVVPVLDLQIGTARLKQIVAEKSGGELPAQPERKAIESGPANATANGKSEPRLPTLQDIAKADSRDAVVRIWRYLKDHDALSDELEEACTNRVADLSGKATPPNSEDVDPARVWHDILAAAGSLPAPMSASELEEDFARQSGGVPVTEASGGELLAYLRRLQGIATEPAY